MIDYLKISGICLLFLCILGLGGCGDRLSTQVQGTTKGQELLDLDEAKSKGLITAEEYEKQKERILQRK